MAQGKLIGLLLCVAGLAAAQSWPSSSGSSSGCPSNVVCPETYNAAGNAATVYDGVIGSSGEVLTAYSAASSTASAPAVTTTTNGAVVVNIWATNATWNSAPSTGTLRVSDAFGSSEYGMLARDQTIATAGSVAANWGTLSSSTPWIAATIALAPQFGKSIVFVNATSTQQSTGATLTVAAPSGIQAGDLLLACNAYYPYTSGVTDYFFSAYPSQFGHTSLFVALDTVGDGMLCQSHWATGSEPGSYAWTQNATSGLTGIILAYRNVQSIDGYSNQLTSASAAFTSNDVGKLICLATESTSSTLGQVCGAISAYSSATQVTLNAYAGFGSSTQFSYGTDDYVAFNSAITTGCAKGCTLLLGSKGYALSNFPALPKEVPIHIVGAGPGLPATANSIFNSNRSNLSVGTRLMLLTQSLSGAALTISGTLHNTSTTVEDTLEGFTLYGGTGFARDGGGPGVDAIDVLNWQQCNIDRVFVFNFGGRGLYIDALAGNSTQDWIENIQILHGFYSYNFVAGIQLGGVASVDNIETTKYDSNVLEMNGGPGMLVAGPSVQGFTFVNNTVQWNNHVQGGYGDELEVTGTIQGGCEISGNYFEFDHFSGQNSISTTPWNNGVGLIPCTSSLSSNFYLGGNWTPLNFPTSSLPACGNVGTPHYSANVSDATACTNGTTLAGGGSTHCQAICNNSAWKETGLGWY